MNTAELDMHERWIAINRELDKIWDGGRALAGEREEIEKKLPYLKNKGVSPYPSKEVKEKQSSSTILITAPSKGKEPPQKKQKVGKSEKGAKAAVEKLSSQGGGGTSSRSEIGMDVDKSQNFPDNK
jgi:hypothetical protein